MKRANYLIDKIAETENLQLAFWKAKRGKENRLEVQQFSENLENNIQAIKSRINRGIVHAGDYHYFTIFDPKERTICAASFTERVLHHALMNVCHPVFEKHLIYDSYATRPGKGTYKALERAFYYQKKYTWYLKLDVRKYFDNIDHSILKQFLSRCFKEEKLLGIFNQIIDSYQVVDKKGIPIGNLSSQYFANHYLSYADWFVKKNLKVPGYVRYMDDMVLWHNDKDLLLNAGQQLQNFIETQLKLKLKVFCFNKSIKALPFLSYLVAPNRISLSASSRKRYISKWNDYFFKLTNDEWSQTEYQNHLLPLNAFVEKADSYYFRQMVLEKSGFNRGL
jgi:RNA-directed DNA polymerase